MKNTQLVGAALLALAAVPAWAQGPVAGRVQSTDEQTADPALPGATIRLDGQPVAATAADGSFRLPAVPAGRHTLSFSALGYKALEVSVEGRAEAQQLPPVLLPVNPLLTEPVLVTAARADEATPTAYTTLGKAALNKRNFGQDIPYLLDQTPSVVVNSDAGAGVGYTGIRIRGTDVAGINVTINGVPLNDAESHGAYFVDLPDLASSTNSIQVQRGVGTSQNGSAAFGASLNISTLDFRREAYGETQNTYGSYNTWKNNVAFGTGLIGGKFTVDGRLSRVKSDGYVNNGFSDLKSYYFAAGYHGTRTDLRFVTFSGTEQTYQAWNGVPEPALTGDRAALRRYVANYAVDAADTSRIQQLGRRYNQFTYPNQTDNYQQNHYQLHLSQSLGRAWNLGAALHLTRGFGYYEEYKADAALVNYGIAPVVFAGPRDTLRITNSDVIRRKWLDNYFYGTTFALNYEPADGRLRATFGGGYNRYDGDHYGEVIWARYASNSEIRQRYYFSNAVKNDYNGYARATFQATEALGLYADAQVRHVGYRIEGQDDSDQHDLDTHVSYTFFNPKAGLTYKLSPDQQLYGSVAVAHREPVRSDFTDRPVAAAAPQAERLLDYEAGYKLNTYRKTQTGDDVTAYPAEQVQLNLYYMDYRNQLVPTGQLNDVGAALRTNIPSSYRMGIELSAQTQRLPHFTLGGNITLSRNRLRDYQEVVYSYDANYNPTPNVVNYSQTPLTLSPDLVAGATVEYHPVAALSVALLGKAVGRQYLDNSGSAERQISPYQVADLRLRYTLLTARRPTADGASAYRPGIELALLVSNLFDKKYVATGYTYGNYDDNGQRLSFNFYYPQATRNYLASVNVRF